MTRSELGTAVTPARPADPVRPGTFLLTGVPAPEMGRADGG